MTDFLTGDDKSAEQPVEANLSDLVGEGKKYATADDLAKAYAHAEAHIKTLQGENGEYRSQNTALKETIDRFDERLSKALGDGKEAPTTLATPTPEVNSAPAAPATPAPVTQPTNTPESPDLSELVRKELENTLDRQRQEQNIEAVNKEMSKQYGSMDNAKLAVERKATELGVSFEWLADMASKTPAAFLELMGKKEGQPSPSNNNLGDHGVNTSAAGLRDVPANKDETKWEYWQELRRTNKNEYYKPETQARLHELAYAGKLQIPA